MSGFILAVSTALQFLAAGLALRLVRVTRWRVAWSLLALAVFLMGVRRAISLERVVLEAAARPVDLTAEVVALGISVAMVVGLASIAPNFREMAGAAERVLESEQRLQSILDNTLALVYVKDPAGRYLIVNRRFEQALGRTREELLGRTEEEALPAGALPARDPGDLEVLAGSAVVTSDETLWLKGADEERTFLCYRFPLRGVDGEPNAVCGVLTDITERVRAEAERRTLEERMLHAQKLESLGVLSGGIAHDFNNLLVPMITGVDLVRAKLGEGTPGFEELEIIRGAAEQAAELCRQLLAYSGRGRFRTELVDVSRLAREMEALLRVSISKRATLELEVGDGLPLVDGNPAQLRQVVHNLVTNASEALGDQDGTISIATGVVTLAEGAQVGAYMQEPPPGEYVFLEVRDSGEGMDEECQAKLFEPFFTTKFTGRGLGLSAVLGIVRGHRGAIRVESAPGEGTCVRVYLPAQPDRPAPATPPEPARKAGSVEGAGVLVVDDEPLVRELASELLRLDGFHVYTAADGREAVELHAEHGPSIDLVLLDMTMPGMDGRETCEALRAQDPEVRILLCSGYDLASAQDLIGPVGAVQKPFRAEVLLNAVREALAT